MDRDTFEDGFGVFGGGVEVGVGGIGRVAYLLDVLDDSILDAFRLVEELYALDD